MRAIVAAFVVVLMAFVWTSPAWAGSITVSTNADEQNSNGRCSLREAIFNANDNGQSTDPTDCGVGTGEDTITFDVDAFDVPGPSATITLGSQLPTITDPAGLSIEGRTLNGENVDITISGDSSVRVFEVANGAKLDLKNLTVADGSAPVGAGLLNDHGMVTVSDSTFSGNSATGSQTPAGGGILNDSGTLTVTDSTFSENSAAGQAGPHGGGIFNSNDGTLTVTDSTLSDNSATDPTGNSNPTGGGIDNAGTLTVTNSTFSGNFTLSEDSTAVPPDPNETYGGGIFTRDTSQSSDFKVTVVNSTFAGNSASDGGGIFSDGRTKLTNSTFSENSATGSGGAAVTVGPDQSSKIIVRNTIVANTTPGRNCLGIISDDGYNIDYDNDGSTCEFRSSTSKSIDPKLDPSGLDENGGPTQTIALEPTSPAVDQGDFSGSDTDQRGETRPQDFAGIPNAPTNTGSEGDGSDIGAYEVQELADQPPVASNELYSTNEDMALNVAAPGVLSNDTDAEGNALSAALVSGPAHGSLTLDPDGSFTYTPEANYNGSDSFAYKANDGIADSNTATVSITVNAVNDAPSFTTGADQTVNEDADAQSVANWATNLSKGPANENSQTLVFLVSNNNNSLFSVQPAVSDSGTLTYTPAPNANGNATVSVTLKDSGGTDNYGRDTSATKTFTITVNAINDAPVNTVPAAQSTDEDTALTFTSSDGNPISVADVDAGGNAVQVRLETTKGKLTLLGNTGGLTFASGDSASNDNDITFTGTVGSINMALSELRFDPDANFNGAATLKITTNDQGNAGSGGPMSDTDTVNITVNPVNDVPTVAVAAGGSCGASGTTGTVNLTVGDVESSPGTLTLSRMSSNPSLVPPQNITFGGSGANRTLTVSAAAKRSGMATVTVTVSDGQATSNVSIRVIFGSDANETLVGTEGTDIIFGKNGNDTINALGGKDLLCGGNGVGTMRGGADDDTLDGANGNDVLQGDAGKDILRGSLGNDRLTGGADADSFSGGPGTDTATDFNEGEGDTKDNTIP